MNTSTIIKKPKTAHNGSGRLSGRKIPRWDRLQKPDAPAEIADSDKELWEVMHQIDRDGWIRGRIL